MADSVNVSVSLPLVDARAIYIVKQFEAAGTPVQLNYRRTGRSFYWEASFGDDSFAVTQAQAEQENYKGRAVIGTAAHTPDVAVINLRESFERAMQAGQIVGFHVRKGDIDSIRFVGEKAGAPKTVALVNYYQGQPTHPFTRV